MKTVLTGTITVLLTLLGLVGAWYGFQSYFVTATEARAEHVIIQKDQDHAREKLEIQVAGALKEFSKQQQDFGIQQQKLLENYRRTARLEQLRADIRFYQSQVEYHKNMLLKNPRDPIAVADLHLAQQMLAQVKAALRELESK